jgi:hypothetical protein
MCGGIIGKVDNFLGKHTDPLTRWTDDVLGGIWKPLGQAGHWTQNHPLETAGAALAAYYGLAAGGEYFGGGGDAAAAGAGAGAAAGAEGSTAMGSAAGTLGAADSEAASAAAGYTAADVGGTSSADLAAGAAGAGGTAGNGSWLSSLFSSGSGTGSGSSALATGKNALGAMQVLSALYGMEQSRKLSKQASSQAVTAAGLQAVQRSMAAQGYQGSGNMMTALSNYGAGAYTNDLAQQQQSLNSQLSSLGLLTAGSGNLTGWSNTSTPAKGG